MKPGTVALLLLLLLPSLTPAQKKPRKPIVPEVFDHARYVYVEAIGGEEFDRGLNPEDRIAIADVRDALKAWGRYTLTVDRDKADLIFVVRKGRAAQAGVGIGSGQDLESSTIGPQGNQNPQRQRDTALTVGGEAGPEDDMLQICQLNPNGKRSGALWIRSAANGLDGPGVRLFAQFRDAVEKAYPAASRNSGAVNDPSGNAGKP